MHPAGPVTSFFELLGCTIDLYEFAVVIQLEQANASLILICKFVFQIHRLVAGRGPARAPAAAAGTRTAERADHRLDHHALCAGFQAQYRVHGGSLWLGDAVVPDAAGELLHAGV